jgi:hypothetical protein
MLKLGGAVIHMRQELDKATFLVGSKEILMNMKNTPVLPIFSSEVIEFLSCLSEKLLHSSEAKKFPDVIAYAFWIRRKSLEQNRNIYKENKERIGRGISFQITPSNIPVQFAVSMTYSLVAGNMSVVRLSSKEFEQVNIICDTVNEVIKKFPQMSPYICMMRYDHDEAITACISEQCDIRMVWGGDDTINRIRNIPIQPRCIEIGFADRYSFAIIDSDYYLDTDYKVIATDFYNDTYYTDQNACSSSRLIIWTGSKIEKAKDIFWKHLKLEVDKKYKLNEISGSEKLLKTAVCALNHPQIREIREDNAIVRVELPVLYEDIMQHKGNSGYFFEYDTDNIEKIIPLLGKECQTITYLGDELKEQLHSLVIKNGVRGVDRIVLMGHSMDLSFVWDGYDLPIVLSRIVNDL